MEYLILAFFGSILPAIFFNLGKKNFIFAGLCGTVGWGIYMLVYSVTGQVILSSFAGAFAVGICSETLARILKVPASILSVAGMFPLVPGIGGYNTVRLVVENNLSAAAGKGIETMASAGAIALGIILSSSIFRTANKFRKSN
jgi:uncharacterized membrane protein YjjB (DUF3815 family)